MKNIAFKSFDNQEISCFLWDEVKNPKGVVQLIHGMAEHSLRYDDFARFLNLNGWIVFADDHRAHGTTDIENLGYHDGDIFNDTVNDEILLTAFLTDRYHLPIVILGHSYGSFIAQRYIELNSEKIAGVILSGSAKMKKTELFFGRLLARIVTLFKGKKTKATFLNHVIFGSYEKPFKKEELKNSWLTRDKKIVEAYNQDSLSGFIPSNAFFLFFLLGLKDNYRKRNLKGIRSDLPILIASGGRDMVNGGNGSGAMRLYQIYQKYHLENVSINLYSLMRHEILNELNHQAVYDDFLERIEKMVGED